MKEMDFDKLKEKSMCDKISLLETINKEIDFNNLLEKYGPDGLYLIADKLKKIADEDVRNSLI